MAAIDPAYIADQTGGMEAMLEVEGVASASTEGHSEWTDRYGESEDYA